MDYAAIYDRFIADRKAKGEPVGYSERHHIVPKCLGGNDGAANLIRLTPEDHYFAHVLLAKIYGGKLWLSLVAMVNLTDGKRDLARGALKRRFQFGHIRRALAIYYRSVLSGPTSKIADQRVHTLRAFDGRVASGNRFELEMQTGVTRQNISRLVLGTRSSNHGWYNPIFNPEGKQPNQIKSEAKASAEVIALFHHDGREWSGTRIEFDQMAGLQLFFQSPEGHVAGWYRTKAQAQGHDQYYIGRATRNAAKRGDISGLANPRADQTPYRWRHQVTGEERIQTRVEFCLANNATPAHVCNILNGRQKQTRGWELLGAA